MTPPPAATAEFNPNYGSSYPPPPPNSGNSGMSAGSWSHGAGAAASAANTPSDGGWHHSNDGGTRSASTGRPSSSPSHTEPNPNLYIHNVPKDATEEELRDLFSTFGVVERIRLKVNQKIGPQALYAFVTYRTTAEAQLALERLNGFDMRARKLRIEFQRSRPDDDRYYGSGQDSPGDRKKRQGMVLAGAPRGAEAGHYDQYDSQQHNRNGGSPYESEGPSYKRPRYFDAEERGSRQRRFVSPQQQQHQQLNSYDQGAVRSVQVLPQPGSARWNVYDAAQDPKSSGPHESEPSSQQQHQQRGIQQTQRVTIMLCEILRRLKPHLFDRNRHQSAQDFGVSRNQNAQPAASQYQGPDSPRVLMMPGGPYGQSTQSPYDPSLSQHSEPPPTVIQQQQQQQRRGSSVSSTTPYAAQGARMSADYGQQYGGVGHASLEGAPTSSSMPPGTYRGPPYPNQQQQPAQGISTVLPAAQSPPPLPTEASAGPPRRGSTGAWLASLARNGKRKLLVEVSPIEGPLERFLTPDTSLFNISHRSSWEDTLRKPQGATCFIRPAMVEMVPEGRGLVPVTLTPPKQEASRKGFQEHVDYLLQKERAGVVTFADKRQLYIIPPGVPLFDQLRKGAIPPDSLTLLGMFTTPSVNADASTGGGSVGQIDG